MSEDDLVTKLRSALLHHQVSLKSVPRVNLVGPNHPTIAYLSSMLLDDDEQQQQQQQQPDNDYQRLMSELGSLVSSPDSASSSPSSSLGQDADMENLADESHTDLLKSMLTDCARAVAANRGTEVYRLAREIRSLASAQGTTRERTALALVDALVARFSGFGAQVHKAMVKGIAESQSIHLRLVNLPYFRVTQIFANITIYEACLHADKIHIVDYGIFYGCQWPIFITRLAQRPGGPPRIRMTGIDFPTVDVEQTGRSLVEFARKHGVSLDFHAVTSTSWETVQPRCSVDEVLLVNSALRLRHLREDGSVVDNPRKRLFDRLYRMKPAVVVTGVLHAGVNMSSPFFLQRFQGSMDCYFTRIKLFEALMMPEQPEEFNCMMNIAAKGIMNVVACEGLDRIERPSSYKTWDARAKKAGFEQVAFSSRALQTVTEHWGTHRYNEDFKMGTDENWLLLGFKDHIIFGMCAWRPKNASNSY